MMNWMILIVFLIRFFVSFYKVQDIICKPPNKFVQIFAPPGTGKTTMAADILRQNYIFGIMEEAHEEKKVVYSNVELIGAYKFKLSDLGNKEFRDCILIIDEAGSEASNRDWRNNLSKKQIRFLKKHRHYNVDIYLFSQAYNDIDNKFRELTTELILLEKSKLPFTVLCKAIDKKIDIIDGQIMDYYEWNRRNSFRFRTYKNWAFFNSWEKEDPLPEMENIPWVRSKTT